MDLPLLVEKGIGFMYLAVGLSLIFQPTFWMEFVEGVRKDHSRVVPIVYVGIPLGLSVVLLHNQWNLTPAVFVTVFGWLALIKSCTFLLFPDAYMRLVPRRETLRKLIQVEGPLLVIICGLILYHAYLG